MDKGLAEVERSQSAVAEGESGKQIERDGGKSKPRGHAGKHGQPKDSRAQLDKDIRDVMWRRGHEDPE
jgi:hypothetical protein